MMKKIKTSQERYKDVEWRVPITGNMGEKRGQWTEGGNNL